MENQANGAESDFPLQYVKGIGPVRARAFAEDGILTPRDLTFYFPRDYVDRTEVASLKALSVKILQERSASGIFAEKNFKSKTEITVAARIKRLREHKYGRNRKMARFAVEDFTGGTADLVFWNYADYYLKNFSAGELITISGTAEAGSSMKLEFHQPEIEKFDEERESDFSGGKILPVYTLTQSMTRAKIGTKHLRSILSLLLDKEIPKLTETLPEEILRAESLPDIQSAVRSLHFPESRADAERALRRMKYEEIFFFETFLALRRNGTKTVETAPTINPKSARARKLYDSLPFELTKGQKRALREIAADIETDKPMNRLLQGDVGSGKTVVAALSMLQAVDSGMQTVLMAPTELLAEQHFMGLSKFFSDLDVNVVQLVGGQKRKLRDSILEDIRTGRANVIIGTHALFSETVEYHKLAYVVIDEQHRFGVAQRAGLKNLATASFEGGKRISPHVLVMSATPIPRTLSLTLYGDLDVSIIREMPKNRKPVITKTVFESRAGETFEFIRSEIKKGRQAFVVYPLVEKSEKLELKSAVEHYETLKNEVFPDLRLGLLHGQMFWYEKDETMRNFLEKKFDILVSTTVIEVGIDIANATVMLIENAERFGLSQLHQLRGRVGRGTEQSYCFLATKDNFEYAVKRRILDEQNAKDAVIRLQTMEATSDGFEIAEADLKLRGPGDVLGTKQSGMPGFKFTDLTSDGDIISKARNGAFGVVAKDPHLRLAEHRNTRREYLRLFSSETNFFDIA